ncbi:MAG: crosslink repair DNA glycosylase YcaQ family protein [Anaerolineales bacterium]
MANHNKPLQISNKIARRFLLSHQFLLPPKRLHRGQIIDTLFARLGCIQFDTINVVGRNADLVLQSRVKNYKPEILDSLLYESRSLLDGWDKVASIYPVEDWPFFHRHRSRMGEYHEARSAGALSAVPSVLESIRNTGPMSSIDFKDNTKTDWFWGPTSQARAALEILYAQGHIGIHHRVNTRRYFDVIEDLVPEDTLGQPDPFADNDEYLNWHILRRIGSLGIASMQSGEHWGGIFGARKVKPRKEIINQLINIGQVTPIQIENTSGKVYYLRSKDLEALYQAENTQPKSKSIAFIAPLDNLIWNRNLVEDLFGFSYTWEVYKPKSKREYGYYVLPVLFKDRFIARADMKFERKSKTLILNNWWWEEDFKLEDTSQIAIRSGFIEFLAYLEGERIKLESRSSISKSDKALFGEIEAETQ